MQQIAQNSGYSMPPKFQIPFAAAVSPAGPGGDQQEDRDRTRGDGAVWMPNTRRSRRWPRRPGRSRSMPAADAAATRDRPRRCRRCPSPSARNAAAGTGRRRCADVNSLVRSKFCAKSGIAVLPGPAGISDSRCPELVQAGVARNGAGAAVKCGAGPGEASPSSWPGIAVQRTASLRSPVYRPSRFGWSHVRPSSLMRGSSPAHDGRVVWLQIVLGQAGVFGNPRQQCASDLVVIIKREHEVRLARPLATCGAIRSAV